MDNNKLVSSRKCDFYRVLGIILFQKKKNTNFYYLKFLGQIYYIFPKWKTLNRGTLLSFEELGDYLSHLYGEPLKILIDMAIANARTFILIDCFLPIDLVLLFCRSFHVALACHEILVLCSYVLPHSHRITSCNPYVYSQS